MTAHETTRQQLTLFIDKDEARQIERLRQMFDPLQSALIDSHITLCREDELIELNKITSYLETMKLYPLTLHLGAVEKFNSGKGAFMPVTAGRDAFHLLRKRIMAAAGKTARIQEPHITLVHPRNGTCTDEIYNQIKQHVLPGQVTLRKISLIEQAAGGRWKTVINFPLQ